MGVPKFFRYMSERYPCLSEVANQYQISEYDNLYLDMNGIIHTCSHPNDFDPHFRISEEKIFQDIFHYIEILFHLIQPQKLFLMAIDGVAPRAKMNQQRGRRFRSAREAEILEQEAKERGEILPKVERFDSNCITPGTVFMARLNEQLKYFVTYKITTDKLWQKCKIILSGHETPGEGEHKIADYIRYMRSQPDYDSNTRHCLYGLDADLIMLGLCTHEPHFSLLREEIKFGQKQKRTTTPDETTFFLLHLSVLREYIEHEFSPVKDKLPFEFDLEKIIDDWVLMGFLVGNDFIPNLPNLHIANGALPVLYLAYMEVLPTLEGYINEGGTLMLDRFEKFMERLSRLDIEQFTEHYADLKYFESKTGRRPNENERTSYKNSAATTEASSKKCENKDLEDLIKSTDDILLGHSDEEEPLDAEEDSDSEVYNIEFIQHKRDYYMNKLEYENVDADVLRSQAECYVRAIQWNLNYYYTGCCSWSWYYPHHYAPYISDIKDFKDIKFEFDMGTPFLPFQQLLAVLPAASRSLLPKPFEPLMIGEKSPIIDFYPADFKTDLNGKRQEWEAVVLIPFIEETSLLNAMEPCYAALTPEEKKRNTHGPMYVYSFTEEDLGSYDAPDYFPKLSKNHANLELVSWQDIMVPKEKLVRGLCPGIKLDVYFPGFPTLKHIEHTAELRKAKVKVFEQSSRGENMILNILPVKIPDILELAKELLGTSLFVSWPHLVEARVVGVSNQKVKYNLTHRDNKLSEAEEVKGPLASQWDISRKCIAENYMNRMGVNVGDTEVLIHACVMTGRRYIFGAHGKLSLEKQWSEIPTAFALQATVRNIAIHDLSFVQYTDIGQVFTPKSISFMLGHPHYGAMGEVVEAGVNVKTGRVKLAMWISQEPNLESLRNSQSDPKTRYMHGSIAAQRLGISGLILSRITGSIYVLKSTQETNECVKRNLGLNLKFNKKNEEVPGYTKKVCNQWLYSTKVIDLIHAYMRQFPVLFEQLSKVAGNDVYHEEDLFSEPGSATIDEVAAWLKKQPHNSVESRVCGNEGLDVETVQEIESVVDAFFDDTKHVQNIRTVMMQVKPHLLFKPSLSLGRFAPDTTAQHKIYDRIVCVRESFTVPLGYKGTIIGIQKAEKICDYMYDVVFDKTFAGGLTLNVCSANRGYRISTADFINISHGVRVENSRSGKTNSEISETQSWRSSSSNNHQDDSSHSNTSAFASFSNRGGYGSSFVAREINVPTTPVRIMKKHNDQTPLPSYQKTKNPILPDHNSKPQDKPQLKTSLATTNYPPGSKRCDADVPSARQSSEFQALWNELHRLQKSNGSNVQQKLPTPTRVDTEPCPSSLTDSPQDPSALLKAMLKISDDSSQKNTSSIKPPAFPKLSKSSDAPPLVQQLFDHARQTTGAKKPNVSYCSQLLTYFQSKGMGLPQYTYVPDNEAHLIRARIVLPDARTFSGDFHPSKELAAESAAKKVHTELNLNNLPEPGVTILPTPPQQWYNSQNVVKPPNVRPMMNAPNLIPPMGMQPNPVNPVMRNYSRCSKGSPNADNLAVMPNFGQIRPPQRNPVPQTSSAKSWRSENRPDNRKIAPFVPLQAQKQHRNTNPRHSTGISNTPNNSNHGKKQKTPSERSDEASKVSDEKQMHISQESQKDHGSSSSSVQNHSKQQRSARQRKSRIAANFGCVPAMNGTKPE